MCSLAYQGSLKPGPISNYHVCNTKLIDWLICIIFPFPWPLLRVQESQELPSFGGPMTRICKLFCNLMLCLRIFHLLLKPYLQGKKSRQCTPNPVQPLCCCCRGRGWTPLEESRMYWYRKPVFPKRTGLQSLAPWSLHFDKRVLNLARTTLDLHVGNWPSG